MNAKAAALRDELMELAPAERAELASELLASLDGEPTDDRTGVDRAWADEMSRRAQQIRSGEVSTVSWDDVARMVADKRRAS